MGSRADHDEAPRRRLRVPGALAVAFVGSSAAVSMWYGGCQPDIVDPPPDGRIESRADANDVDADDDAVPPIDAPLPAPDTPRDAGQVDAPPH